MSYAPHHLQESTEQVNGRESETATLFGRCPLPFACVNSVSPTSSQPLAALGGFMLERLFVYGTLVLKTL